VSNGAAAGESGESSSEHSPRPVSALTGTTPHARAKRPQPVRRDGSGARVFGLMGMSLGAHMAILAVLGLMPKPEIDHKPVEMEIVEPEPAPPPPPPPAAEPPKAQEPPAARPKLAPRPAAAPKQVEPEPSPPPAAAEAPVDLTGVTLTGNDGASWSSAVGNGEQLHGPAARIGKVTGRDRAGANDGVVGGTGTAPLVNEASLSRKPIPPEGMDALLEQNFPARARAQGVSGTALLRVRIHADGHVGEMQTLRETGEYGFGAACMKALRQRRWQPPLDRKGTPVTTEIRYSCEFEVSY
jgi:TonB family protein